MSPATHVFFDHPQEPDPVEGGNVWATRYIDAYRTFSFMPFRYYDNTKVKLSGEAISKDLFCPPDSDSACPDLSSPENIIGVKGVMRTLRVKSLEEFDFQVYPRLLALAERAWYKSPWEDVTDEGQRKQELASDWARFATDLGNNDLALLDQIGVKYRVPPPGVRSDKEKLLTNVEFPGLKVQFRMADSKSGSAWTELSPDIKFDDGKRVLLRVVSPDGNRFSREVKVTTGESDASKNNNNNNSNKNSRDGSEGLTGSKPCALLTASLVVAIVACLRNFNVV
ncbi:beta-hexosaminidase [Elysia marginata]|uniref:beta-N-acetylhexosaminidase n=1 Tax=Elysia marginata TaxID=1093978 RepID=A0AAV4H3F6_9GAST|nr:beta-hexosaminidase [Elysia marginata]